MTDSDKKSLVELIDKKGNSYGLCPMYNVNKIFNGIPMAVLNNRGNYEMKEILENQYIDKYTRFNMAIDFCLRERGWKIINPLLNGRDDVLLFYQNELMLVSYNDYLVKVLANKAVKPLMTFPKLSDTDIGYVSKVASDGVQGSYVRDEKGFIDLEKFESRESAIAIMMMFDMFNNEKLVKEYVNSSFYKENNSLGYYEQKRDLTFVKKIEENIEIYKEEYAEMVQSLTEGNQSKKEITISPILH